MTITFLIGNGFNTSLGLDTRYSDFYKYVIGLIKNGNPELKNNVIIHSITTEFGNQYDKRWSDLEWGLGTFTELCKCKPEAFLEQKDELEDLLYDYLEKEQRKIDVDKMNEKELEKYASVFNDSLVKFADFFPPDDKKIISDVVLSYGENIRFNVVDFNYTNALDDIWDLTALKTVDNGTLVVKDKSPIYSLGEKMHIHGELGISPILGVDNIGQIVNKEWRQNSSFIDLMIKERMNIIAKLDRTNQAKRIINDSTIICVYGMSLGKTDQMWWQEIANWLYKDGRHKLIIYAHCENRNDLTNRVYKKRQIETKHWERFKNNISFDERKWRTIRNSIIIQNSMFIFNFPKLNQ